MDWMFTDFLIRLEGDIPELLKLRYRRRIYVVVATDVSGLSYICVSRRVRGCKSSCTGLQQGDERQKGD